MGVGSSNIVVGTSLGGMDAKCGDVSCSRKVFDENAREKCGHMECNDRWYMVNGKTKWASFLLDRKKLWM